MFAQNQFPQVIPSPNRLPREEECDWPILVTPDTATLLIPVEQDSEFLNLPDKAQEHVLSFLTYQEVASLRLVSKDFARICESWLNLGFSRIGPRLDNRIRQLRSSTIFPYQSCIICKALYITLVEYRFLRAACWRYLHMMKLTFFAGSLLDQFYTIIRLSYKDLTQKTCTHTDTSYGKYKDLISSDITDELAFMVEKFIAFFDTNIEPEIEPSATQIGVKSLDILDCFLGSNSDLELTYDNESCTVRGHYTCPLFGVLYGASDDEPAVKHICSEVDLNLWLADFRELARKSNQRYIGNMIREFSYSYNDYSDKPYPVNIFSSAQRCKGKIRSGDGNSIRERIERRLHNGRDRELDSWCLKVVIRVKFPEWQWPLELKHLRKTHPECDFEFESDTEMERYFDDLVNWAYSCRIPPKDKESVYQDDYIDQFWFQSEVCRSSKLERNYSTRPIFTPTITGSLKLSFQPSRFRQLKWPSLFHSTPTIHIRDVCIGYEFTKDDKGKQNLHFISGRVRKTPGCTLVSSLGPVGTSRLQQQQIASATC